MFIYSFNYGVGVMQARTATVSSKTEENCCFYTILQIKQALEMQVSSFWYLNGFVSH